ncbi:MAG TPA: chain-length determining protein [Candidatus Companilactobacillus pullicola]|uniref:Capsular polysaccharide biosynthesis protein CpsC n=1 Tax=Candidatus Companilactobacillus pullicola TaxID=2838523 RepID=A0A9D1ZNH0_9LACO|nr:chain-length determining protein [Candidatus Companilactobacillus pullicola]
MENQQKINVLRIWEIIRKHIRMIIGTAFFITIISIFVTFFVMTPKYSATTEILVNRKASPDAEASQFQQAQADVQLISTYKDIITSPTVLNEVNQRVRDYPGYQGAGNLSKSLSISNAQNSQVFSLTAKSTDAGTAAAIANETASVFKKRVGKLMSIDNVSIVSRATVDPTPTSPKKILNILIGIILGIIFGIAFACLKELSNRAVTTETELSDELGLTSLGIVDEIDQQVIEQTDTKRSFVDDPTLNTVDERNYRRV